MSGEAGKGDTQRPKSITEKEWAENWNKAFGKVNHETLEKDSDWPVSVRDRERSGLQERGR